MRDFTKVYQKAADRMGPAFAKAFAQAPPMPPVVPRIDDLWKQTTMGDVQNLSQKVGPDVVAQWLVYMKEKGGGRW